MNLPEDPTRRFSFYTWLQRSARPVKVAQVQAARMIRECLVSLASSLTPPVGVMFNCNPGRVLDDVTDIRAWLVQTIPELRSPDNAAGMSLGSYALVDNYRTWRSRAEQTAGIVPYVPPKEEPTVLANYPRNTDVNAQKKARHGTKFVGQFINFARSAKRDCPSCSGTGWAPNPAEQRFTRCTCTDPHEVVTCE